MLPSVQFCNWFLKKIFCVIHPQAHGHIKTSNPLEDVLKNSLRNEAKLIGYDEEPIDAVDLDGLDVENIEIQDSFEEDPVTESKTSETSNSYIIRRVVTSAPSEKEESLPQTTIKEAGILMGNF